jgi:hypothetical protein
MEELHRDGQAIEDEGFEIAQDKGFVQKGGGFGLVEWDERALRDRCGIGKWARGGGEVEVPPDGARVCEECVVAAGAEGKGEELCRKQVGGGAEEEVLIREQIEERQWSHRVGERREEVLCAVV